LFYIFINILSIAVNFICKNNFIYLYKHKTHKLEIVTTHRTDFRQFANQSKKQIVKAMIKQK